MKYYREESKKQWGTSDDNGLTLEQINTGALLRIADAMEVTATNFIALQADRDYYKRRVDALNKEVKFLERSRASLRGKLNRGK